MSAKNLLLEAVESPHLWLEICVLIRKKVPTVPASAIKKSGLIPDVLIPPNVVTRKAPTIGPTMPINPIAKVSQQLMAVAL